MSEKRPRVLFLDIETRPAKVFAWRMYDENISPDQVIEPGGTICFGAKWQGEREMIFYSDWEHGHDEMIRQAHRLFSEADAIVTYNGDRFDIPKLQGQFILAGLAPPPPPTSIDVFKTVKKLGFDMNKLAFIGPLLKVGAKIKHQGFTLWTKVLDGDVRAQRQMQRYCIQDVKVLEKLYDKVKPYIKNHPHLGETGAKDCGACGSHHLQSRGFRRTKAFRIQRLQCQTCGSWQDGTRNKM